MMHAPVTKKNIKLLSCKPVEITEEVHGNTPVITQDSNTTFGITIVL